MRCAVVFCLLCAAARAHWYLDPDQALRQARAQGKPLLVYGWDGRAISPVLHRKPFRHARLRRVADRFIMLKVKARGANALRFGLPRGQAGVRVFSPEGELLGSYRAHNLTLERIVGIMKQFAVGIAQRRAELNHYVLSFGRATPEQAGRVARLAKPRSTSPWTPRSPSGADPCWNVSRDRAGPSCAPGCNATSPGWPTARRRG